MSVFGEARNWFRDLMAGLRLVGHHDQLSRQNVTKQTLFSTLHNR
jgi:hypothetical protein